MPFTDQLGTNDSQLANIQLGILGGEDPLEPSCGNSLNLVQGVVVEKTLNVSAQSTITFDDDLVQVAPKVPIVGFSGGQARFVYVKDITNNQELYLLDEDDQLTRPASTVKMMTALIIMQWKEGDLDDTVTVISADISNPLSMTMAGLQVDDVITFEGLLYGIFLASGLDACQAAARVVGDMIYVANGSVGTQGMTRFIEEMNNQAAALGMGNSNFTGVSGESQTGSTIRNVMSARDAAILGEAVFEYDDIRTVAGSPTRTQPVTGPDPRDLNLINYNRFINGPTNNQQGIKDENVVGGKNGVWLSGGNWNNLVQLWTSPSGAEIIISVFYAESLFSLMLDVQGIMYSILRDFPYLQPVGYDPSDATWTDVKMLVGADGSIVDESDTARALTTNSVDLVDPVIVSENGGEFTAQTDYIRATSDDADLQIGSDDATIELWYMGDGATSFPTEYIFFSKADHTGTPRREWLINNAGSHFQLFVSTDGVNWGSAIGFTLSTEERKTFYNGAPRHLALVKEGTTWSLYMNGERGANTLTGNVQNTTVEAAIGYPPSGASFIGVFDDFRLTIGSTRYTEFKHTLDARKFPRHAAEDQSASNSLTLSQLAVASLTINVSASSTLDLEDDANKVVDGEAEDEIEFTDDATFEKYKYVDSSDALVLDHALTAEVTYERSMNQPLVLTQQATKSMYWYREITSVLTLSNTATAIVSKLASDLLELDHEATFEYSKGAKNTLEITQVGSREMTFERALFSNFIPFQTLAREATFRRSIDNTLSLTQSAIAQVVKAVSNTLVLAQEATCYVARPAFSTFAPFDLASENHTSNVEAGDELIFQNNVTVQRSKAVAATSILGFNQFARANKVLTVLATDTVVFDHELVADYLDEEASDLLELDHDISVQKIVTASCGNTLALTQTLDLSKTIVRAVADILVFKDSFEKRTGITSLPTVTIPAAQVTITKQKCVMILESTAQSITLPCPEFNDSEGSVIRLNVKRSMDGTRRAYKRDNPTSQLKYDLVMDRLKAIELRQFLLINNSSPLKLTNFKGELWMVLLTNSPFSFTEDAFRDSDYGNRSTISLEFEGVRLN